MFYESEPSPEGGKDVYASRRLISGLFQLIRPYCAMKGAKDKDPLGVAFFQMKPS